jgi:hypothetical protein
LAAVRDVGALERKLSEGLNIALGKAKSALPAPTTVLHSAFTNGSRLILGQAAADWSGALAAAAAIFKRERERLGRRFKGPAGPDHDLVYAYAQGHQTPVAGMELPKRAAYGLPHNYFLGNLPGATRDREKRFGFAPVENGKEGRRASPVLFKVLEIAGQKNPYVPVVLWLRTEFLPNDVKVYWRPPSGDDVETAGVTDFNSIENLFSEYLSAGWREVSW